MLRATAARCLSRRSLRIQPTQIGPRITTLCGNGIEEPRRTVRSPLSPANPTIHGGLPAPPAAVGDGGVLTAGSPPRMGAVEQAQLEPHPAGTEVRSAGRQVALAVASDYMRLSRAASLEQVYALFAADAGYRSDALGTTCEGLPAIRTMMDGFFAKFPDVRWEVTSMGVVDSSEPRPSAVKVAVEFVRYWTDESGKALRRSGREWIYVDPESARIVFVHVAPLDP